MAKKKKMSEDAERPPAPESGTSGDPAEASEAEEAAADANEQAGRETVELSYAEYEELKTMAAERDDYLRRLQRAVADRQNMEKRLAKFRNATRQKVTRELAENILPVADNLSLALEAAEKTEGAENIVEGLEMVEQSFYEALEKLGIRPIEAAGRDFDPEYHEAVMQQPMEGVPPNRVVRELKKGFKLKEQVIRPTQVIVSGPAPAGAGEGEEGAAERE